MNGSWARESLQGLVNRNPMSKKTSPCMILLIDPFHASRNAIAPPNNSLYFSVNCIFFPKGCVKSRKVEMSRLAQLDRPVEKSECSRSTNDEKA